MLPLRRLALAALTAWLALPVASADPLAGDGLDQIAETGSTSPCDDLVDCLIASSPLPEPQKTEARARWEFVKDTLLCTRSDLDDPRVGVSVDGRECDSVGPRDFVGDPLP
ncbi:MAG TPA: hypothetical protein VHH36_08945 [Candidatus Thermoplasmatota archaeon]|nr:hypothetical protein [Candidatus Thermoplasmatota archaeon]